MTSETTGGPRRLVRVPVAGRIGGVCAGMAAYLDTDVTLVRVAWIVFSIVPGGFIGGVVAYVAAWLVMPEDDAAAAAVHARLTRSVADRKIAGVCGGIAHHLEVDATAVRVAWVVLTIVPGAVVLGVLAYVAAWFVIPAAPAAAAVPTPRAA